jgi:hypothetical protein
MLNVIVPPFNSSHKRFRKVRWVQVAPLPSVFSLFSLSECFVTFISLGAPRDARSIAFHLSISTEVWHLEHQKYYHEQETQLTPSSTTQCSVTQILPQSSTSSRPFL